MALSRTQLNTKISTDLATNSTIRAVEHRGVLAELLDYVDATKLPLTGGTMTGNINFNTTDTGITWAMNTDGAYIKFFNTGDGDTNSRLEYGTSDNGDEYHRWVIFNTERMNLKSTGLTVTGAVSATSFTGAGTGLTGTASSLNIGGNAATATKLQTARNINGVSFDGSANITIADSTRLPLAGGTMTGAISFAAVQTWPTFNQNTSGNAATATKLATARDIGGVSFDGSANINLPGVNQAGNQNTSGKAATATLADNSTLLGGQTLNQVRNYWKATDFNGALETTGGTDPQNFTKGYTHFSNGLLIQWGWISGNDIFTERLFSVSFTSVPVVILSGIRSTNGSSGSDYTWNVNPSSFQASTDASYTRWLAIGFRIV